MEPHELTALDYAAEQATYYLVNINKTDLNDFTLPEWKTFIQIISVAFISKKYELAPCPF